MRIAHICQTYPPMISGQSLTTQQLVTRLAKLGHSNFVYAASDRGVSYSEYEDGIQIRYVSSHVNPFRVGQRFMLWQLSDFLENLKKFEANVIHIHDPGIPALLMTRAAQHVNVPQIITVQQLPLFISCHFPKLLSIDQFVENIIWKYFIKILQNFDRIVAPSMTAGKTISLRIKSPVDVISNGIDLEIFQNSDGGGKKSGFYAKYGLKPELPTILHVGQINTEKRVDRIIKAAIPILRGEKAQLLIVGDGKKLSSIKKTCETAGVGASCHFTGYIRSRKELALIYELSTLFVTASEIETQGIVLLEAAAAGLPIVAVNATCIPEIVRNRITGFLVEANDTKAMTEKILHILQSGKLAYSMSEAGKSLAQQHDFQKTANAYEGIYFDLLGSTK